ncbi:MAG: DNA primase [Steroidobacteraceae bacterium]
MAGRIPQGFIDELIARADIVELIGERVPLKKSGREFKACCPFHDEKTPSFWVSPDKQFFHCFGCGAHGTALGFLIQYDQLAFPEAVEELARRVGMEVPREAGSAQRSAASEGLTEMLGRVAGFYAEQLDANQRAQQYLRGRGLTPETLQRFRIGYAPDAWQELLHRFGATEESRRALLAAGLVIARERPAPGQEPYYDRFRDRVMFPIRDARGRVIAFGGRVLDRGEPKYLNSPETALFHKGRELYGLYEVRQARLPLKRLLVVEGYMDVARLHQSGIHYAVATLGTATTAEHLKRAFRLVSEIVFCFDGDRAGRAAAWRALQNVLPEAQDGREIRFLFLPEGEDPDSLVGKEGREAFEQRIAGALPLSEYLLGQLRTEVDLAHADGRARYVALARPLLARLGTGVYRELLIERLAADIGFSGERLRELLAADAPAPAPERAAGAGADGAAPRPARRAGRGGLVTQAIQLLLHFPAAAARWARRCARGGPARRAGRGGAERTAAPADRTSGRFRGTDARTLARTARGGRTGTRAGGDARIRCGRRQPGTGRQPGAAVRRPAARAHGRTDRPGPRRPRGRGRKAGASSTYTRPGAAGEEPGPGRVALARACCGAVGSSRSGEVQEVAPGEAPGAGAEDDPPSSKHVGDPIVVLGRLTGFSVCGRGSLGDRCVPRSFKGSHRR